MFKKYSNEVIVGLFVIVCAVLFAWIYTQLKGQHRGKGIVVYAVFETANGLLIDNAVTMAGVKIGRVGGIDLYKGKARVKIALFPGIKIRKQDVAAIQAKSLLGEKVLSIMAGSRKQPALQNGDRIFKTKPTVDITDLFASITPLRETIEDLAPELKPLAKEVTKLVKNLNAAIEKDPEGTRSLIKNINGLLSETRKTVRLARRILYENRRRIRRMLQRLNRLLRDRRITKILQDVQVTAEKLPALINRFQRLSSQVEKVIKAVPTGAFRKIDPLLNEARLTLRDIRQFTGPMKRTGPRFVRLVRNLDKIFQKLRKIDERDIRNFLQIEGVLVRMFLSSKVKRRIKTLNKQSKRKTP